MLQDLKLPVNPKETSLMTHPDASMKMYDISKDPGQVLMQKNVHHGIFKKEVCGSHFAPRLN